MADSSSLLGARPVARIAACCADFQSSLIARVTPLWSNSCKTGWASPPLTDKLSPSPRMITLVGSVPLMEKLQVIVLVFVIPARVEISVTFDDGDVAAN